MNDFFPIADSSYGLIRPVDSQDFSVCFPSPIAIGASADPDTAYEAASLTAQSAAVEGIPLLLTPAVNRFSNIHDARRGLCFSDDPSRNTDLTAAWVQGLQENGVGAVLRFLSSNSPSDLEILHKVISRVEPCAVATDLTPILDIPILPDTLQQPLTIAFDAAIQRAGFFLRMPEEFDWGMQHHQARKLARRGIVLLKNEDKLLPIHGNPKIAMIGAAAQTPCFQSDGLPPVHCTETLSALQSVRSVSPVRFAMGYDPEDTRNESILHEAVSLAADSDLAILFLQAKGANSDTILSLPSSQENLLKAITQVQKHAIVVLYTDRPVQLPWVDLVSGLVVAFPGGQAGGAAVIDLLFGAVSFSGKLPFAFPHLTFKTDFGLIL